VDTDAVRRATETEPALTDNAVFTARVDARTAARPGDTISLAVDPAVLYWFEPETGASLARGAATPGELVVS
jgi:multiple sugar transport system ATP-binding protein